MRAALVDPSQQGFSASRGGGFPIELSIRGRDWDALARYSRQIQEAMIQSGKVTDVNSDYQVGMPEVRVIPDRNKAADLDVSMADIGQTVNAAIGGTRIGQVQGGPRAGSTSACGCWARSASGRRTSSGLYVREPDRAAWCACPT